MVKSNSSFTLIEILVVTAIVGVVTSMSFAGFHRQQTDEQLKAEARKMASMIGLARKKASVNDVSPCVAGIYTNDRISKYNVKIILPNKYEIFPNCVNNLSGGPGNPSPETITYQFGTSDIVINKPTVSDNLILVFSSKAQVIEPMLIEIKNNVTDRCCQIDINSAGVIKEIPCATCVP